MSTVIEWSCGPGSIPFLCWDDVLYTSVGRCGPSIFDSTEAGGRYGWLWVDTIGSEQAGHDTGLGVSQKYVLNTF